MGRKSLPPRLWRCPVRGQWVIRDRAKFIRLGTSERTPAEEALAGYIKKKPPADKSMRLNRKGTVYVIGTGPYVKIGFTRLTVVERLKNLKVSMPETPTVIAEICGSRRDELVLHHRFAEYRLNGEWFRREGDVEAWISDGCQYICAETVPVLESGPKSRYPNLMKYSS